MSRASVLDLVDIDPSRFVELDVARCAARLGGSMIGRQIVFPDESRLVAALDVLFDRFGGRYFVRSREANRVYDENVEMLNA